MTGLVQFTEIVHLSLARALILAALFVLAIGFGAWWRSRQGVVRGVGSLADGEPLTERDLGAPLGSRATLVQFSSSTCAPCRTTRRLLSELVADDSRVALVELDVEEQLPLVRRLDVLRTPTVIVLDARGRAVHRLSGVPDLTGLRATLRSAS